MSFLHYFAIPSRLVCFVRVSLVEDKSFLNKSFGYLCPVLLSVKKYYIQRIKDVPISFILLIIS